jgi:cytoskeleton protein RodZ
MALISFSLDGVPSTGPRQECDEPGPLYSEFYCIPRVYPLISDYVESCLGELGMDSIGDALRSERLRRSLTLEQVAAQTKIGKYHLEAIEANQFDRLPGGLFTRSFLRQYARVLDLDAEEVVASFKQQFEEPVLALTELQPKRRRSLPLLPRFGWFAIAIVVCGGVYTLWENVRRSLPETSAASLHSSPVISESGPQLAKSFREAAQELAPRGQPALVPSASSRSGSESSAKGAMRVIFTATEPVWVSIQSDGTSVYTGVLEQQHNKELDASSRMTALVGNAGGLEVSLNGKAIGPIGQHGEVRVVELTPAGAHIAPRTVVNDASSSAFAPARDRSQ